MCASERTILAPFILLCFPNLHPCIPTGPVTWVLARVSRRSSDLGCLLSLVVAACLERSSLLGPGLGALGRGEVVALSWEYARATVTLAHAMTIHKSQSRTLEGHVRICPGNEPGHVHLFFSRNHLLVAASRARGVHNLSIE